MKGMTMRKRLTKKDRFFNDINFTADDDIYVGIDACRVNILPLLNLVSRIFHPQKKWKSAQKWPKSAQKRQ